MRLNKIQRLFVRLTKKKYSRNTRMLGSFRPYKWKFTFGPIKNTTVEIINAVNNDKTTAKIAEDSKIKAKRWLKLKNVRAQFTHMNLSRKGLWLKLTENDWHKLPVIVKIGTYQAPYVVDHIGILTTIKNKTTCTISLEAVDNVDYLTIINEKKEKLSRFLPKAKEKKKRVKK